MQEIWRVVKSERRLGIDVVCEGEKRMAGERRGLEESDDMSGNEMGCREKV